MTPSIGRDVHISTTLWPHDSQYIPNAETFQDAIPADSLFNSHQPKTTCQSPRA